MCQSQVLIGNLTHQGHSAGSVCKYMEYFQINTLMIIGHTEHVTIVLVPMNQATWISMLFLHLRRSFAVLFHVVPEKTTPQTKIKSRHLGNHHIHRLLEQFLLNLFLQNHTDSIGIRHCLTGNYRKNIRCIIQFFPLLNMLRHRFTSHVLFSNITALSSIEKRAPAKPPRPLKTQNLTRRCICKQRVQPIHTSEV